MVGVKRCLFIFYAFSNSRLELGLFLAYRQHESFVSGHKYHKLLQSYSIKMISSNTSLKKSVAFILLTEKSVSYTSKFQNSIGENLLPILRKEEVETMQKP